MNNTIKKLFITLGTIGIAIVVFALIKISIEYEDVFMMLCGLMFLNKRFITLFAFSLIMLATGLIMKKDNNVNLEKNEINEIREQEKKPHKKIKWKILLFIGILPFAIVLGIAVFNSIFGFSFMFSTNYGMEAFLDTLLTYSFLFWPTYIVGVILIIVSSVKLKKSKQEVDKN